MNTAEYVCKEGDLVVIRDCRCHSNEGAHNGYTGRVRGLRVHWGQPFYVVDHAERSYIPFCWSMAVEVPGQ